MKNKWEHDAINCQEDEDGFNLNLASVFNYESEREKQDINSNENNTGKRFGPSKLTVAPGGARQRISQRILSLQSNS